MRISDWSSDVCSSDLYGSDEWDTEVSSEGFSRGVEGRGPGRFKYGERPSRQVAQPESTEITPIPQRRFAAVVQLLSVEHNLRLRVTCFAIDDSLPIVASVTYLWPGANWFERAAVCLFGLVFQRRPGPHGRLHTQRFVGPTFTKEFPLTGKHTFSTKR